MQPEPAHIVNKRIILLVSLVILVGVVTVIGILFNSYETPKGFVGEDAKVLEIDGGDSKTTSEEKTEILKRIDTVGERPLTREERDVILSTYDGRNGKVSPEEMKKVMNALNQ